ncbi:MAG: phage tail protein [Actinomycetota bacterium]|nr:phage tail protein [Actinomycetota bacterium]
MPGTTTTANGKLLHPVKYFLLRVPDIDTVGLFTHCSGLSLEVEVFQYVEGGNNWMAHNLPTRLRYPNLVLKRGLSAEEKLLKWFEESRAKPNRKEVAIHFQTATRQILRTWTFVGAYPVKWTGPTFEATSDVVALETLEIAHEGLKGL